MRRLRLQLLALLILAILLPTLPVVLMTQSLIRRSLDPLLETGLEGSIRSGLAITREVLDERKASFLQTIMAGEAVDTLDTDAIASLTSRERTALRVRETEAVASALSGTGVGVLLAPERMRLSGTEVLIARVAARGEEPVWVVDSLPADLVERANSLTTSIQLLETLRLQRRPITQGLLTAFIAVYGFVLGLVLLLGFSLASRIARPLTVLGEGIERVADGDLETQVPEVGGRDGVVLLRKFNEMVRRLRSQQAELLRLEKLAAWRQMARRLAHEIKNPLTPIQLAAQQMRDEYPGDDPRYRSLVNEATAIIEEEVRGLRELVSDFSRFARLPPPQQVWVDPKQLLGDLSTLYGAEKVEVRSGGLGGTSPIWCDRDQIHRVLINLVENALAAQETIGASDPILIEANREQPQGPVTIHVLDRGPGISEPMRRKIFEPDVSGKKGGMGLGLAIAESTIRQHGGEIEVHERSGGGADFLIHLPAGPSVSTEESDEGARLDRR
jgi:nitrogen fixation/metabolism regulation signal transduction histidine kinase